MNISEFPNYAAWLERLKTVDQGIIVVLWCSLLVMLYLVNFKMLTPDKFRIANRTLLVGFFGSMIMGGLLNVFR